MYDRVHNILICIRANNPNLTSTSAKTSMFLTQSISGWMLKFSMLARIPSIFTTLGGPPNMINLYPLVLPEFSPNGNPTNPFTSIIGSMLTISLEAGFRPESLNLVMMERETPPPRLRFISPTIIPNMIYGSIWKIIIKSASLAPEVRPTESAKKSQKIINPNSHKWF